MLKPQVDEEMSGALSVAVQTLLQTFAQTHGGDGLTLSLACFNLYTVNQLALVCSEWHALVGIYDSHPAVGVVFSLFLFAAQRWSHRSLLQQSGRRSEVPSGFELAIGSTNFSDHAFGKMAAIALGMYRWRPQKNLWRETSETYRDPSCKCVITHRDASKSSSETGASPGNPGS